MKNNPVNNKVYVNAGNVEVLSRIEGRSLAILDIGCGAGDNAKSLKAAGHTVDGVTLSKDEAEQAQSFCRKVYVHNLESGLPEAIQSARYNYVICSHVLEHICFPEKLLEGIQGCLKDSGSLVVALPNLMFIRNRWHLLRGRFDYQQTGLMDNTHFRWYTFLSSRRLLEDNGFKIIRHYGTGFVPLGPVRRLIPKLGKGVDRFSCQFWPGLFSYQIIIVVSK